MKTYLHLALLILKRHASSRVARPTDRLTWYLVAYSLPFWRRRLNNDIGFYAGLLAQNVDVYRRDHFQLG